MTLSALMKKESRRVIGLMSGTSVDGIDAVLVDIQGCGTRTRVHQLAFVTLPFPPQVRRRILELAEGETGGSRELCLIHMLLGQLFADDCEAVCRAAGVPADSVDLVGSHGQTLYHQPEAMDYLGTPVRATLQLGEASCIADRLGCPVVSDFRVRDMAAGGLGAPLVSYTEFLLYRDGNRHVALQNIGGIGNVTLLPAGCALKDVIAFDTGPGNMVVDALAARITGGRLQYDKGGEIASSASPDAVLLEWMAREDEDYLSAPPPKATGRERCGAAYLERLWARGGELGVEPRAILATAMQYTALCIGEGIARFSPFGLPHRLVVGGGGSRNPALMGALRRRLPKVEVLVNEDLGLDSDAKEAVAFAVLANEAVDGLANNAPSATGASRPVVMGKISQ